MDTFRRTLAAAVAAVVMAALLATPALAAPDYRGAVDITFPVIGGARYSDDYANGRSGGRVHRATDLFGSMGQKIVAARGGTIIWLPKEESGLAGFAIQILGDDGRTYAYYHLGKAGGRYADAVSSKLSYWGSVKRGQYLGRLGNSGNAVGTTPHLHFEIQDPAVTDPYGSARRNPYASLRKAQGLSAPSPGSTPQPPPAKVTPQTNPLRLLRVGHRGIYVERWQRRLNRSNRVADVSTDGVYGPGTEAATITFQKSVGLGPEGLGVVGPNTRREMRRVLGNLADAKPAPKPSAPKPAPKPPAQPATSGDSLLRLGDDGPAVTRWQRRLNRSGRADRVTADGDFGPATQAATIAFQKSVGLGPVGLGVVGPKTRAAMRRVLS